MVKILFSALLGILIFFQTPAASAFHNGICPTTPSNLLPLVTYLEITTAQSITEIILEQVKQYKETHPVLEDILLVNKSNPLSSEFEPKSLVYLDGHQVCSQVKEPLVSLLAGAKARGFTITINSAYRSYNQQEALYNRRIKQYGLAVAVTLAAPPGYSEHQTGLAVDLGTSTSGYSWLASNAWRYGFILRYPSGKESITGYTYEPWHFRYVGIPIATYMNDNNISTLEEFKELYAYNESGNDTLKKKE